MEYKHQTPSVIAKLMGLGDEHPRHYARGKKRVFSEKYQQKVASIGVRVKRSFHEYHSFGTIMEEKDEAEDDLKVFQTIRDKHRNLPMVNDKEDPDFPKAKTRGVKQVTFGKRSDVLKPASKNKNPHNFSLFSSEDSFVAYEASDKNLEQEDVIERWSIPAHGLGTGYLAYKLGKRGYQSNSSNAQLRDRKLPNPGPVCVPYVSAGNSKIKTKNGIFNHHRFLRHDASINWEPKNSKRQKFCQKDCSEHINLRSKSKKSLSFLSYLSSNHKEENCIYLHELKAKYGNDLSDQKLIHPQSARSEVPSNFKDCQILQETCLMKDEVKNHNPGDSNALEQISPPNSSVDCVLADTKTEIVGRPCGNPKDKQCGAVDRDFSCHASYNSVEQGTSEFHEEDSVRSICSGTYPDSLVSLEEVFEPSPISVLETPFREDLSSSYEFMETVGSDVSSSSECVKIVDSDICDPSETDNEGHDLDVSSDEDPEEGSIGSFKRKQDLSGFFRVEETRDFSYVVEVLTEAGVSNRSLHTDFSTWHSPECPISPSVFEILEKKFGEQPLWKRSDRKLLFDCINLGLLEILNPCMCIPMLGKPMLRRLIAEPSQDMIEEELWALLVAQEKEAKKESADKMLVGGIRWVELSEEIEAIVRDIVKFLIDEFAEEIVCLESF
ncbi:hypothetical protein L6164_005516 [Bauhinia variegata]|uniref:Uncharacterized protein n=1 Tax=Bauhinia variegata TaxID=167791 RepID=A0ACB9PR44_BAUVA|nr:hypothetical protein L6164_005516 [Bauhinia variegata]